MPRTTQSELQGREVGASLLAARKRLRLTQRELAERLNATQSYVSAVEAGRRNLTVGQLANIADALGTGLRIEFELVERESTFLTASI